MSEYRLRPAAIADLDEIWEYTVRLWGTTQAERYLEGLRDAFDVLADQPGVGRARNDLHPGLLVSLYSRHLIFYQRAGWGIDIVRILHGSLDIAAQRLH